MIYRVNSAKWRGEKERWRWDEERGAARAVRDVFTAMKPGADLHRLGQCSHHCSPPSYTAICVCKWELEGGRQQIWDLCLTFEVRKKRKKEIAYLKVLPIISPHGFTFFFMPTISLPTTITVSWSKPIDCVERIQISSAPAHSWYCCFCRAQMYSCHFSSLCRNAEREREKKNILHTVCLP